MTSYESFSVHLFHFREHVRNKNIDIVYCLTDKQLADIFTKPLPICQFEYLRKLMIGW